MGESGSSESSWAGLEVLVLSPTPTHPLDAGNRRRIHFIVAGLRRRGARVVLVHYPGEADWRARLPEGAQAAMAAGCDELFTVPVTRPLHPPAAEGADHGLDDWWDPAIGDMLAWIFATHRIDVCLVNYTWMSRAFDFCPAGVLKVLDTHDRFSGRREVLARHGIGPEFFHLTPSAERAGLRRADLVWSIKPQEAAFFRSLGIRRVINMPHAEPSWSAPPARSHAVRDRTGDRARKDRTEKDRTEKDCTGKDWAGKDWAGEEGVVRFGIIGARNNVNRVNIETFLEAITRHVEHTLLPCEIVVAGSVCELLDPVAFPPLGSGVAPREAHPRPVGKIRDGWRAMPWIRMVGRVERVADFYDAIDVVLAPIAFSTGLKIKVGEALCHGRAVVALAHAFEGFSARHPFHALDDLGAMLAACRAIVDDPGLIDVLARLSPEVVGETEAEVARGFADTLDELGAARPGVCIVVAANDLFAGSLVLDHVLETAEYLGRLTTVSVFLDGTPPAEAEAQFWVEAQFLAEALGGIGQLLLAPALFDGPLGAWLRSEAPRTRSARMDDLIRGPYFAFWFASAPRPWPAPAAPTTARAYLALDALALGAVPADGAALAECVAARFGEVVAVSRRGLGLCLGEVSLAGAGERRVPLLRRGERSRTLRALHAAPRPGSPHAGLRAKASEPPENGNFPPGETLAGEIVILADAADTPLLAMTMALVERASDRPIRVVLPAVSPVFPSEAGAGGPARVRLVAGSRCFVPPDGPCEAMARPFLVVDLALAATLDGVREVLERAGVPAVTLFDSGARPAHGRWAPAGGGVGLWDSLALLAAALADDLVPPLAAIPREEATPDFAVRVRWPGGYGDDAGWSRIWYEIQDLARAASGGDCASCVCFGAPAPAPAFALAGHENVMT